MTPEYPSELAEKIDRLIELIEQGGTNREIEFYKQQGGQLPIPRWMWIPLLLKDVPKELHDTLEVSPSAEDGRHLSSSRGRHFSNTPRSPEEVTLLGEGELGRFFGRKSQPRSNRPSRRPAQRKPYWVKRAKK